MKARTETSESTGRQVGRRRALLWLSGLGGLLGLGWRAEPASAANGDPIRAGQVTAATGETGLLSTPDAQPDILLRVQGRDPGGDAIHAQGAAGHARPDGMIVDAGSGLDSAGANNPFGATAFSRSGDGVHADGGAATSGRGGAGLIGQGGGSDSGRGGVGIDARGGRSPAGESGGGVHALGGSALSTMGRPGPGVHARGGDFPDSSQAGGVGVEAQGAGARGQQRSAALGQTNSAANAGVVGRNFGTGSGVLGFSGVNGGGPGIGVRGVSGSGRGGSFVSVSGPGITAISTHGPGADGSCAENEDGAAGTSLTAEGVYGETTSAIGIAGYSTNGVGGHFETRNAAQYAARANNSQAAGGEAGNGALGLHVNGDFVVQNGTKSAAVRTSRGLSLLYCMEAPIAVFEDFGRTRLSGGQARVELDPIFAETIDTASFRVFLTPAGADTKGLAVVDPDAHGFTVQEAGGGNGNYELDYRVVGLRKGLPPTHRLSKFSLPTPPSAPSPAPAPDLPPADEVQP